MTRLMRASMPLAALVTAVVAVVWALLPPSATPAGDAAVARPAPAVGSVAPGLMATAIDGTPVDLAGLRGTPVWVSFGATWCAPCRVEAPDIQAAHDGRVAIVAVYMGEDPDAVRGFTERLGLTYTHVPDADGALSAAWGVRGIPVHHFLDADGVVRSTRVGILGPDVIAAELNSLTAAPSR